MGWVLIKSRFTWVVLWICVIIFYLCIEFIRLCIKHVGIIWIYELKLVVYRLNFSCILLILCQRAVLFKDLCTYFVWYLYSSQDSRVKCYIFFWITNAIFYYNIYEYILLFSQIVVSPWLSSRRAPDRPGARLAPRRETSPWQLWL